MVTKKPPIRMKTYRRLFLSGMFARGACPGAHSGMRGARRLVRCIPWPGRMPEPGRARAWAASISPCCGCWQAWPWLLWCGCWPLSGWPPWWPWQLFLPRPSWQCWSACATWWQPWVPRPWVLRPWVLQPWVLQPWVPQLWTLLPWALPPWFQMPWGLRWSWRQRPWVPGLQPWPAWLRQGRLQAFLQQALRPWLQAVPWQPTCRHA